jgi:hypothetical protein
MKGRRLPIDGTQDRGNNNRASFLVPLQRVAHLFVIAVVKSKEVRTNQEEDYLCIF